MPYTDATGTILIDDVAASGDVAKLKEGRDKLVEAVDAIQQVISLNSDAAGIIKESIDESMAILSAAIKSQIETIEISANYINHVVEHYKAIDQTLKGTINTVLP